MATSQRCTALVAVWHSLGATSYAAPAARYVVGMRPTGTAQLELL
ncbi:hypothetical protein [Flavobacterium sp.]